MTPPTQAAPKNVDLKRHMRWIRRRLGIVFDGNGGNGSGIFLELPDGRIALLTAKHVVTESVLTGELTLQSSARLLERSYPPGALAVAASVDAALIYVPTNHAPEAYIPYASWAFGATTLDRELWLVATGHPGLWKSAPDFVARTIASTRHLNYVTFVDSYVGLRAHLDVVHQAHLPSRLNGMSGGPICDTDHRLRGIIVQDEHQGIRLTGIMGIPLSSCWALLHNEAILPPLKDYAVTRRFADVVIENSRIHPPRAAALLIEYLHHRSVSQPEHVDGTLAIVKRVWLQAPNSARPFEIHVLSNVGLDGDDLADECYRVGNQAISALGLSNWRVCLNEAPPNSATDPT